MTRAALPLRAMLPDEWLVDLPLLGRASVSIAGVIDDGADGMSADPVLAIRCGAARGRVSIDAALASRIVDAMVGAGGPIRPLRALGPAERGVLAGALGGLFDRLGWLLGTEPPPAVDSEIAAIVLRVATSVGVGTVAFRMPAPSDGQTLSSGDDIRTSRLFRLPLVARLELATTRLRAVELAGVQPGDAVVFDTVRADRFAPSAGWPAMLVIGDPATGSWPVEVDAQGNATVGGRREARQEDDAMDDPGNTVDATITAALAAAPVEVVAELGRTTLRGEQLAGLAPGAVLALGGRRAEISLRVAGERWAEGELVDVDGELGVRVTRVLRG